MEGPKNRHRNFYESRKSTVHGTMPADEVETSKGIKVVRVWAGREALRHSHHQRPVHINHSPPPTPSGMRNRELTGQGRAGAKTTARDAERCGARVAGWAGCSPSWKPWGFPPWLAWLNCGLPANNVALTPTKISGAGIGE
ncbi:hypothetical protein VFPBJ_01871 [Purpureocillium lilacinum]|uniref:Uncharacterized protein n=1 Tax=Purpureocillium lilacinum TaxID=33203 RepID=A0A179HE85_PURLI|nr:hypothetical protein VFPBJ_01871 [Purpureocillium lilacinum]